MSSRIDGLGTTYALFAALGDAARTELKGELLGIARDVLAEQQKLVPVYDGKPRKNVVPGKLKAALTVEEAIAALRVRIGYPQLRKGRTGLFYALIMEKGRRGQTVTVQRMNKAGRKEWRQRIVDGRARARKKPTDLVTSYRLRVTPLPARVHVHIENRMGEIINSRLAGFWDRTLSRAGQ